MPEEVIFHLCIQEVTLTICSFREKSDLVKRLPQTLRVCRLLALTTITLTN
jgi:hypothetical protein